MLAVGRRADLVQPGTGLGQAALDAQALDDFLVVLRGVEAGEVLDGLVGQAGVAGDLGVQALRVPRRAQDVLPLEQGAELRARQVPALAGGAVDHDLQQGPQRRHGPLDGAVSPVVLGHHLVGGDDDVH